MVGRECVRRPIVIARIGPSRSRGSGHRDHSDRQRVRPDRSTVIARIGDVIARIGHR
jgi:hypothetical protein